MHLVFLNQYYPPDAAPTGVMLEAVADELARSGHEVTVLCAAGGYAGAKREDVVCCPLSVVGGKSGRVANGRFSVAGEEKEPRASTTYMGQPTTDHSSPRILRLRASRFGRGTFVGKLMDYASYYFGVAWNLAVLQPRPDRIVALTTPPFLSVLARMISKFRGADHAHWVMDLYPDVMAAHGMLGERSLPYRLLKRLARWGFGGKRCAAVLTLGPDMAQKVASLQCSVFREEGGVGGERDRSGAEGPLTTDNRQPTTVSWVPLWGSEGEVIRDRLSECGVNVSELGKAGEASALHGQRQIGEGEVVCSGGSATVAGCFGGRDGELGDSELKSSAYLSRPSRLGESAAVADAPLQASAASPSSTSSICPSTLDSQLSTSSNEWLPLGNGARSTGVPLSDPVDEEKGQDAPSTVWSGTLQPLAPLELRRKRGWKDDELIVMYSGNMGLGHRFGEILEAVRRANIEYRSEEPCSGASMTVALSAPRAMNESRDESRAPLQPAASFNHQPSTPNPQPSSPIRFVFFGGGKRRGEIEAFLRENPGCAVELHDYAPAEELAAHLQTADVHLASLDPAWTGTMVPSKLQGIFAAGRPVIFVGSEDSSIGQWVNESGGGWVVEAGDVTGLLAALMEARDPEIRAVRGQAAKAFARKHFDKATNVARVAEILTR